MLYGANGEQISVAAINFHDSTFDQVEGYQFVQTEPGRCVLNILPQKESLPGEQINAIRHNIYGKFGTSILCDVKVVSKLELSPRGKYSMVIQRIDSNRDSK